MSDPAVWIRETLIPQIFNSENFRSFCKNRFNLIPQKITNTFVDLLKTDEVFMLTMCYKIQIEYESVDGQTGICHLVVKKTPNVPEDVYANCSFAALYHNEISAYTELLSMLEDFEKYPKYFYSHIHPNEAVIVLGDFSMDGWRMSTSRVNLSLDHILLAVRELAKFHGTTFALKHKNPENFKIMVEKYRESRYERKPSFDWATILKTGPERSIKLARECSKLPKIPEIFLDKLTLLLKDPFNYGKEKVKPKEPLAVLCHGDYLRNNIAFKYDLEEPEKPLDAMMFDLQTLRYSSPMVDLVTFMANSTGTDIRSQHFKLIFQSYCKELILNFSKKSNISVDECPEFLSAENLLKEYIRYLPYGIMVASSFLIELHAPSSKSAEVLLNENRSFEELRDDVLTRGGMAVDRELCALVRELYTFSRFECERF